MLLVADNNQGIIFSIPLLKTTESEKFDTVMSLIRNIREWLRTDQKVFDPDENLDFLYYLQCAEVDLITGEYDLNESTLLTIFDFEFYIRE